MPTNTDTLYIKMKTETGSEVWRNMAPSVNSGDKRLNFNFNDYDTGSLLQNFANAFVPIQLETPALDNGEVQYKVVSEYYLTGGNIHNNIQPGTDAWTDTTDEKLLVSVTNGDKDGTAKLPRAASALGEGSVYYQDYEAAVTAYSQAVASHYRLGDTTGAYTWTQTHLTGTKDTLVAQNS